MGTTADKIAGKIGSQLRSKIIDLSGLRAAKDIFEEAQLDADGLKKLISKGHDPCHAVYIFAQRFASVLGEKLSERRGNSSKSSVKPRTNISREDLPSAR